jgi:hypothetical protein
LSIPKAPKGLGPAGRALWRSVLADYWMDGESHKLAILGQACKVTDRIAELEAAMDGQPLTVLGSARQLTIHPLIAEVRSQRGLLASLLKALALPDGEEEDEQAALSRSQQARRAANARWNKGIRRPTSATARPSRLSRPRLRLWPTTSWPCSAGGRAIGRSTRQLNASAAAATKSSSVVSSTYPSHRDARTSTCAGGARPRRRRFSPSVAGSDLDQQGLSPIPAGQAAYGAVEERQTICL